MFKEYIHHDSEIIVQHLNCSLSPYLLRKVRKAPDVREEDSGLVRLTSENFIAVLNESLSHFLGHVA